jgi:F-type H+-transporting ATPase subunit a
VTLTPTIVAPDHSGAPKLEPALFTQAATLIAKTAEDGGFHGPSIDEFFPDVLFSVLVSPSRGSTSSSSSRRSVVLFLWLGTRRMRVVPGRFQSIAEMGLDFVRATSPKTCWARRTGSASCRS